MNNLDLMNKVFLGEVSSIQTYGAFVKIPGEKCQGLIHKSQISRACVDDVSEVLQKGDRVWCKVIKISDDDKISLSMKVVDQGNGKDLDPNGVEIHQDEQRRRERPDGSRRKKIELEAVLNTTCTKCGTRGHLAKDCFKDPGGKTYELLPDDDDEVAVTSSTVTKVLKKVKKEKKKHKKEKKRKKKNKHDGQLSSNDCDITRKRKSRSRSHSHHDKKKQKKEDK